VALSARGKQQQDDQLRAHIVGAIREAVASLQPRVLIVNSIPGGGYSVRIV
jgi:hypothetical protein